MSGKRAWAVKKAVVILCQWVSVVANCVCMHTVSLSSSAIYARMLIRRQPSASWTQLLQQSTEPEAMWYMHAVALCASSRHSCLTVSGMRLLAPRRCCTAGGALCCWVSQVAAVELMQTAQSTQHSRYSQDSASANNKPVDSMMAGDDRTSGNRPANLKSTPETP